MKKILDFTLSAAEDILMLAGIGLLFYGTYQIYQPAAFIVLGICLIGFALMIARRG